MLANNLTIYKESQPIYRMILAYSGAENKKLISLFSNMGNDKQSKDILNMIGIDSMVLLTPNDLERLGGVK
jgi:Trm5-related predicted tRNA methylase